MSQLYGGSICLTDLIAKAKEGHSAFSKANNGKIYFNFNAWLNDEPDQYGNDMSVQLNSSKDKREAEGKVYIGKAKKVTAAQPTAVAANDVPDIGDLPF